MAAAHEQSWMDKLFSCEKHERHTMLEKFLVKSDSAEVDEVLRAAKGKAGFKSKLGTWLESKKQSMKKTVKGTKLTINLDEGAGVNTKLTFEIMLHELLYFAAKVGRLDIVKFLVETRGADVNLEVNVSRWRDTENRLPIEGAAAEGQVGCLKYLLEKGADVNPTKKRHVRMPLVDAVLNKHTECVKLLLASGANANIESLGKFSFTATAR